MAVLVVNNKIFNYPDPGQEPGAGDSSIGYGEDATAWAEEVTAVLSSLQGAGDIIETTALILNNQTTAQDISGLLFSTIVVRAANISYTVFRSTTSPSTSLVESGTIYLTFDTLTSTWYLGQTKTENSGVIFSITPTGQVQYTSSDMTGTGYTGQITFQAKTLGQ